MVCWTRTWARPNSSRWTFSTARSLGVEAEEGALLGDKALGDCLGCTGLGSPEGTGEVLRRGALGRPLDAVDAGQAF